MDVQKLQTLPGTPQEEAWLRNRLETLSVKEGIVLTAVLQRAPPESRADAINHLLFLPCYDMLTPAENYQQLGGLYFYHAGLPEDTLPYTDLEQLGRVYEDMNPGVFIENCYVIPPQKLPPPAYDGNGAVIPEYDEGFIKVKLSSPAHPEGAWISLPDIALMSGEVQTALHALQAQSLEECTLLDARCRFPEMGDLTEQYDNAAELVRDGECLGDLLSDQGLGIPGFMDRFAATLNYENCHDLRFALDIARNFQCYECKTCDEAQEYAKRELKGRGVSEKFFKCIDLDSYAYDLMRSAGYRMTDGETAYVTRNNREFVYEHSAPREGGMTMQ